MRILVLFLGLGTGARAQYDGFGPRICCMFTLTLVRHTHQVLQTICKVSRSQHLRNPCTPNPRIEDVAEILSLRGAGILDRC